MRSRKAANEQVAEVARRRLELLSAELAGIRREIPVDPVGHETTPESAVPEPTAPEPASPVVGSRPGRHAQRPVDRRSRIGGWLHDRLPPTLQGRVGLDASHVSVVALLVALALGVTAWCVVRAEPDRATIVPTVARASPTASPSALTVPAVDPTPGAVATPSSTARPVTIVVDVAGKVRRPGIASLPVGARVVDALEAAGGARRGVNLSSLNLARVLVDGEQILVGIPGPTGVAAPAASAPLPGGAPSASQLVNLNSATQPELETLPGVGPVTAESILAWRTENGAFSSVDELLEVSGIGDATLAEIAPFVTL